MKKNNWIILLLVSALTMFFTSCSKESKALSIVKNGYFNGHDEMTVGKAVNGFFANPEWEAGYPVDEDLEGFMLVDCTGGILYGGEDATASIQFIVDLDEESFLMNAFEINGQPTYLHNELIDAMFE